MIDRVLVVGGGVLGAALAAELRRRGRGVVLLEKAVPGAEASTAAAGILAPQAECDEDGPLLDLCLYGAARTRELCAALVEETGVDPALERAGLVHAFFDEAEGCALRARVAWQTRRGLRAELLSAQEALRLVPALSPAVLGAACFPDDHHLDTRAYAEGIAALARRRGAVVKTGAIVREIAVEAGRCRGVRLAEEQGERLLEADAVVVCAGAWSALLPGAGITLEHVHPLRGQIVQLQAEPGALRSTLWGRGGYVVPRRDGRLLCGSTLERAGFDKAVTAGGVRAILEMATALLPALSDAPISATWSGLRPGTKDGLPLLGPSLVDGLFLNTGHFRNGILLAAASAALLADVLEGAAPALDLRPFSPARFFERS